MAPSDELAKLAALMLVGAGCAAVVSACSPTCRNAAYDVDLEVAGASSPVAAIDTWRDEGAMDMPSPPEDGWTEQEEGDGPNSVTLVNDEDDWVVSTTRTNDGGWVVTAATRAC